MSACVSTSTNFFDSDYPIDNLFSHQEFPSDHGFSLDNLVAVANERAFLRTPTPVHYLDANLFHNLDLSPTSSKRKLNDLDNNSFSKELEKKSCHGRYQPLSATLSAFPSSTSSTFEVNTPLKDLCKLLEEALDCTDLCMYEYDDSIFQWQISCMTVSGTVELRVQIFELPFTAEKKYSIEATYVNGDWEVFEDVFDQISNYVQNLTPLHFHFQSEFSTTPYTERLANLTGFLLKQMSISKENEDQCLSSLVDICCILDESKEFPGMKLSFDKCRLLRALTRMVELLTDFESLSSSSRWILAYSLRCIVMLIDFDQQYRLDIASPGYRPFKTFLYKLTAEVDVGTFEKLCAWKFIDLYAQRLLGCFSSVTSTMGGDFRVLSSPVASSKSSALSPFCNIVISSESQYHVTTPARSIFCSS